MVSCLIAIYIAHKMDVVAHEDTPMVYFRPFHPRYIVWLLWLFKEIIVSSVSVSRYVWKKDLTISPVLSWIPSVQETDVGVTAYANSITLTPGTVCIDTISEKGEKKMLVHALVKENLKDLEGASMDKKIKKTIEG